MKSKRFRYLGTTYTLYRLFENHHFNGLEKLLIENIQIGESRAFVPGSSCKAYQLTRIQ